MKSVVYVLGLMFLLMFIFAIIGYYYFGDPNTGDPENWGDLGCALFTLFSLVTVSMNKNNLPILVEILLKVPQRGGGGV